MIRAILTAIRKRRESRRVIFEMGVAWGEMSLRERGRFLAHLAASDDLPKGVVITKVQAKRTLPQAERGSATPATGDGQ